MTIFVSIIGYRDPEISKTVKSLLDNADNPQELFLGVVTQDQKGRHPDFKHIKNIKHVKMHFAEAKGAGYARKVAMELYGGQDFYFQIDSHMRFESGWDTKMKDMLSVAQEDAQTEKVILSQFPAPYVINSENKDFFPKGDKDFWDRPSWTRVVNALGGVWAGKREEIEDLSKPHPSHTILAGLLFAPGNVVEEIPYDERIAFMGEELCFAIRAYTRGWKIYAPNEMLAYHFYKRKESPKIWKDNFAERQWSNIELNSQNVQKNVLLGLEEGIYGIGDYSKYLEYQEMIGIDFQHFYNVEIPRKTNLSILIEEVGAKGFIKQTGFCANNFHEECLDPEICECNCHEGKRNVRDW